MLLESCRHDTPDATPAADAVFTDLLSAAGIKLTDLTAGQPLLCEPNLFASLSAGFEARGTIRLSGGFVLSTQDYGCVWQGEHRSGPASREEIRSALEWGENLLTYGLKRAGQTA